MGNSHCRPREGGENLREYLSRKFRAIAGKRKIDDLVTIAIENERAESKVAGGQNELHLNLEDIEDYETDSDDSEYSASERNPDNASAGKPIDEDKLEKKNEVIIHDPPSRQEVSQYKEDNDYIRVLQEQLKQVQSELANLHRGKFDKRQTEVFDREQDGIYSSHSFPSPQVDESKATNDELRCETAGPTDIEIVSHRSQRNTSLHAQGDVTDRSDKPAVNISTAADDSKTASDVKMIVAEDRMTAADVNNTAADVSKIVADDRMTAADVKKTAADVSKIATDGRMTAADDKKANNEGRRNKVKGMITEGLRTRSDVNHTRTKAKKPLKPKEEVTVEDETKIAEKIAKLQKRDPALPRPDKGIVYPKTMNNLSDVDKAYYVEQFLRSEVFRQRCLRKYQKSTTWMNGLSPFQLWVLENEGTVDIENVLHPLAKRQNNAQAKVRCWRGNTPPPQPKSP
ncbi:uncharacterized protein LOC132716512 isoform X2 [Ruditapes philippinarum]|uniref:uncharacterized protein LOC132716512 isoform X2 n=1 Tax=Ruditapes philippinarum TaxID=129788 RepID=UPI00295A9DD0|nr:uncharacterized protein LOC132716512 isoform X2 [Ruditapes philippinarum]